MTLSIILNIIIEHRRRLENRQSRKQVEESKISYQKEVERFHARLKIEEEDEEEV